MSKNFKKVLLLTLVLLVAFSTFAISVSAATSGNVAKVGDALDIKSDVTTATNGNANDEVVVINNYDELVAFRDSVNNGNTYAGKLIKLNADIDLTGKEWIPIGTSNYDKTPNTEGVKMFAGNFDGGNHTITGLSSKGYVPEAAETGSTEYSFGLFGYVYGANISNVKLANVDIDCGTRKNSSGQNVYGSGVAALIGYYFPADEKASVIENCHVLSGTVKASNNMGGLIGHMDSQISQPKVDITIKNCSNAAAVTTEAREAGGILGLMNSARQGNYYVTMSGTVKFENCVNTGAITSLGGGAPSAGGILGRDHNQAAGQRLKIIFDRCENSGTITVTANGETHAAGIGAGFYSTGAWMIAQDCINTGNVVVNGTGEIYAGGLISYGGVVELIDSTSTGTVTGNDGNKYVGNAHHILFLDEMDDYEDTVGGYTYYLNGGISHNYSDLVDDASGGGNFHLVENAYKEDAEFLGWYDNPEFTGEAYTALNKSVKTYYAKWKQLEVIEIRTWDDLKALDARVEGGDMLEGVIVKLMNDIDLYEMGTDGEPVSFSPIGANQAYFKGTFDGQGHTIKNMYQSGWALGYDWDNYGTIGLFAYIWNATIKNLTIENAECFVEGGNVAAIAGCAWGNCTFENITVKNSTYATYNNRAAGIVGYTGGGGTMTFKDITVDEDTVIAGLWGSFDSSLGGVVGSIQDPTKHVFENVTVACRLDAYNDVTAAYDYYAYRMCGMLIGRIPVDSNNQPILDNVTIGEDVVIDYSNTPDYTYVYTGSGSKSGWNRVETGYAYGGVDLTQYPEAEVLYKPFNSMFGGQQYGSYGQDDHEDIVAEGRVAAFDGEYFVSLENAIKAADGAKDSEGNAIPVKLMADYAGDIVITESLKLDLNVYSFTGNVTAPDGYKIVSENGEYIVKACVVAIGEETYSSLAEALAAANAGDIITLLADVNENVTINKAVTIHGNGKTFTGKMTVAGNAGTTDTVTFNNVKFLADTTVGNSVIVELQRYAEATFVGCDFTSNSTDTYYNSYKGITVANDCSVEIKNSTASKLYYMVHVAQGSKKLVVENCTLTDMVYGIGAFKCTNVSVKDVTYAGMAAAINVKNSNASTLALENVNITTSMDGQYPVAMWKPDSGVAAVKYTITLKGENIANGTEMTVANEADWFIRQNESNPYEIFYLLDGKGTQEDPYLINNIKDLIAFRNSVNAGETKYNKEGVYVALGADIDMSGVDWSVNIGDDCNATFDGIFDGKNHTISNLTSTETAQKSDGYICTGLFGAIYGSAQIKNLTIENVTINVSNYSGNNVGAVVGFAYACNGAVIENVEVIGNVNINAPKAYGVGAIVGYAYYGNSLTIKNCSVEGNNNSAITASSASSGIIGYSSNYNLVVNGCKVNGVALNATAIAGGLAGVVTGGTFAENTVENVIITVTGANWKNSAAVAVGTLASTSVTVENTTYSNVNVTDMVGSKYAEQPTSPVAKVQAKIGDTYYYSLEAALAAANEGETITLLTTYVVEKGEKLELNKAVTITYTSNIAGEDMITNRGTLIIDGVTLIYKNTDTTASNVTVSTISSEAGSVLEVKSGVVQNDSANVSGIYAYAIDLLTNGNLGNVTATISGGEIISANYMAIRQFNNGTACVNSLTVTGGDIYGAKRAIQIHMDNNAAHLAISGGTIEAGEGGYALCLFPKTSTNISVSGGNFVGTVYSGTNAIVSGGTFDKAVAEEYCADGYIPTKNADGTFGVKKGQFVARVNGVGYESLAEAFAAVTSDSDTVYILNDVTENLTGAYLRGNIVADEDVTITLTNSDWVYCPYTFVLDEDITLNVPALFYYAGGTVIRGKVVAGAYYQRYAGTKLTIEAPGSLTVNSEMFYIRYMDGDPNAGIYIIGDGDDSTVELKLSVAYFYQGMINAKDANIVCGVYWQTNETDGQGSANLVLDNSKLTVTVYDDPAKATGNSTVTLTNGSVMDCRNGGFTYDENADFFIDSTSKIIIGKNGETLEIGLNGSGTEADPYKINNLEDLILFRDSVNAGETKYNAPGVYVVLTADIDLAGINWVGIGSATADHGFMGNFDGNGKTIKNLTITNPTVDADGYAYAGFFSVTEGTAGAENVIKNLIIENVTISTTGDIVAAAIAYPYYTTVDNITVCGDINITGGNYTAGALAYTRRCVNASNVTVSGNAGSTITGKVTVGGVISDIQMNGGLKANYSNFSVSNVTIKGEKSVGGISGIISGQTLNGATVKDVTLVCNNAAVGTVAGSWGDVSTIKNITVENVTGTTAVIGATYKDGKAVEAKIGDTYYATFEQAIKAAFATVYENNGAKPTVKTADDADYATLGIWGGIDWTLTADGTLTIAPTKGTPTQIKYRPKQFTVGQWPEAVSYNSKGEGAAIAGWPYDRSKVKTLVIKEGVTSIGSFTAQGFTNLTGEVVIPSTVTYIGQEAFQKSTMTKLTFAAGGTEELCIAQGAFKNLIIEEVALPSDRPVHLHAWVFNNCHNLKKVYLPASIKSFFGTNHIDYFKDFNAHSNPTWTQASEIFAYNENIETITFENEEVRDLFYSKGNNGSSKDYIVANVGLTSYGSFEAAWAAVTENGGTITLYANVALTDGLEVPAGKEITLNLNGKTISGTHGADYSMIHVLNGAKLTVDGNGKITCAAGGNNVGAAIWVEGELVLESGTIELTGSWTLGFAVDVRPNAWGTAHTAPASFTMNGGKVVSTDTAVRVASNSSDSYEELGVSFTMNGGSIESAWDAIFVQHLYNGNLDVNVVGGTVSGANSALRIYGDAGSDIDILVSGGEFTGEIKVADAYKDERAIAISGGTFSQAVAVEYCADGYIPTKNTDGTYGVKEGQFVASVNGVDYESLQAAINAATAGQTITFLADINENVTISKNLTINGANFKYTGTMTANAGLTVAVQNVNFVNGGFAKSTKSTTGNYTITNCTFDGNGTYAYPLLFKGAHTITVEGCTVKNYVYSFLYVTSSAINVSVKDVTVENCPNYAVYFASGVNNAKFENLTVKNSNNGFIINNTANRTFTIKNCTMENVATAINHASGTNAITCTVLGTNNFGTAALSEYATIVLAEQTAILTAPDYANVTTNVADSEAFYKNGIHYVAVPVAAIGNVKYETLQEAIDAAQNGETVVLLKDITVSDGNIMEVGSKKYKVIFNVEGKNITLDLNGKTIDVDYNGGQYLIAVIRVEDGAGLTVTGDGKIDVAENGINVAYMFWKAGTTGYLTVENGTYHMDDAGDSMVYTNGSEIVTINGGKFTIDNIDTRPNQFPCIFNVAGQNQGNIIIKGGTFNDDINHQYYCFEAIVPFEKALKNNGDGTWTVVDAVAWVGEMVGEYTHKVGYATLAEAIAAAKAGETVTVFEGTYAMPSMKAGITIVGEGDVMFEGTLTGTLDNLTLKNIHIKGGNAQRWAYAKGELVFENVTFEATSVYALHFDGIASGTTLLYKDCTIIGWAAMGGSPASCTFEGCTFKGNGTYGIIRTYFDATIENCRFDVANVNTTDNYQDGIHAVSGAKVTVNGCTNTNGDMKDVVNVSGASVVVLDGVEIKNVAKIGDTYYATLADAIAAAQDGDTITLLDDIALDTIIVNTKKITLDLNGKTITGTDNTAKNFSLIDNRSELIITGNGKMTLVATVNSGWNRYSAVIANNPGGKLTIENGTIQHLGGTDMAYGIDNLTNGKGTYAETIVNGGTIKSTYRAIRQFLNGVEAENILTVNGGTIEGANKSIWMQDPSKNANTGELTIGADATIKGDVYLTVTADSTAWPVEVSIAAAALKDGSTVLTTNVPEGYVVENNNGTWGVRTAIYVVEVNDVKYESLQAAIDAATAGDTIKFLANLTENVTISKNLTINGANFKYTGTMTANAGLTVAVQNVNFVNGGFAKSTKSTTGNYTITNCTFDGEGSYAYPLLFKGAHIITVEGCTVKNYVYSFLYVTSSAINVSVKDVTVENCPNYAVYFGSGVNNATFENLKVKNSNNGFIINNTANRTFTINNCTMENVVTAINHAGGTNAITCIALGANDFGTAALSEYATIVLAEQTATLKAPANAKVTTNVAGSEAFYKNGIHYVAVPVAAIGDVKYATLAEAIANATAGQTITFLANITEDVTISKNLTIDGGKFKYTGTMSANAGLTVTVQNVNFVNGGFDKPKAQKSTTGTYTIKNCTFDGNETYAYAFRFYGANNVIIENCTVKDYVYSFLYIVSGTNSVSVKDVTVENCPNYAVYFASGVNNATVENLTVKNSNNGFIINNTANRTFTINNCTMENVGTAISESKGTNAITCIALGNNNFGTAAMSQYATIVLGAANATLTAPEGLTVTTNADRYVVKYVDGAYKLVEATAQVGDKYFETLQEAVEAAQTGDTVVLLKDITVSDGNIMTVGSKNYKVMFNVEGKNITLDLNGKTITVDYNGGQYLIAVIRVEDGAGLTVTGNGGINVADNGINVAYMFWKAGTTGYLTVVNGTYYMDDAGDSMFYTNGSQIVTINGGNFTIDNVGTRPNKFPCFFNVAGQNQGNIIINGGTFNDDINHQHYCFEAIVPFEKALKNNGDGTWTVVDAVAWVGEMVGEYTHKVGYATFAEALNAAAEGETITLLADALALGDISKNVTILKGELNATVGKLTAGTYDWNVSKNVGVGYCAKNNGNGTWTVSAHAYKSVVTDPTCTTDGYTTYTCDCGDKYVDNKVAALGHTKGEVIVETVPATCTTKGSVTTTITCTVCGKQLDQTVAIIPSTGHTEVIDNAVAPTCTETGLTEGKHCSVCGETLVAQTVVPANGHTWDDATCTTPKTCSVCHVTEGEALGHTEETIPAVAPTYTATGLTEGKKCSVCDEILVAQEEVPALVGEMKVTATLELKNEIYINFKIKATGFDGFDLTKALGIRIYDINGNLIYESDENTEVEMLKDGKVQIQSHGIAIKNIGDMLKIELYVEETDFVKTVDEYCPASYAYNAIKKSGDAELINLCKALLNFASSAQIAFNYNVDTLVNANLSDADKEMSGDLSWDESYLTAVVKADENLTEGLKKEKDIFTKISATLTVKESFDINFKYTISGEYAEYGIMFWSAADYQELLAEGTALSMDNATDTLEMKLDDGCYVGSYTGIVAKNLGDTVYACAYVVDAEGVYHYSGVSSYSVEKYAENNLKQDPVVYGRLQTMVKWMVIYGEIAKQNVK